MSGPARALIGLGGNIGDPPRAMREALRRLDAAPQMRVAAVSRLYRTPPWGLTDQPWFFNSCAALETGLGPRALLDLCLAVERSLKRERGVRWGPRTLDLDLLDHGGAAVDEEGLELPHPRMGTRAFVMVPLAEIAPDLLVDGEPAAALAAKLDRAGIEPASPDGDWWRGASD